MSGILGVWNSQKTIPWQAMLNDLRVLGTDCQGDWHDHQIGLSLGRTQSYNTPQSAQENPVVESQGCVLVWDGRLDERDHLLSHHSSATTDAQLIIESYRRWGVNLLSNLTGEFALILWDRHNDLLLVGCDVVGERTLAYYWNGQTLLLSSRVLTLLLHPQVSEQFDELYLAHTLGDLWAHPPGITAFRDIKRLQPGFALILKSGQLQERQVAQLIIPEHYQPPQPPEFYYEQFWHLLNQAVRDRLRTRHRVCTTLSGGLDSTTVTVSLLNLLPQIDAFSTVTKVFPSFDECQPIKSFLQYYPQVTWHPVNSDHAWSLSEPWEQLPVPDDPIITCTLAMNIHLMEQIRLAGFGLIFDGEWGDELFYTTLPDLVREGHWRQFLSYLTSQTRWHSALWYTFVFPRLSTTWQDKFFTRWQHYASPLPEWMRTAYAQQPQTQLALRQRFLRTLPSSLAEDLNFVTSSAGFVAINQVYKLIYAAYGLESTSPLGDQRLIKFALSLPPRIQDDSLHDKIFLRQVNQSHLPEDILWRPKDNYFDHINYMGIAKGKRAVELLEESKSIPWLQDIIDLNQVEFLFNQYRQSFNSEYCSKNRYKHRIANHLYVLFSLVNWQQNIKRKYKKNPSNNHYQFC